MTYSVGFRAPAVSDIMDSFLLEASEQHLTDTRYYDPPLGRDRNPAEIRDSDIQHFRALVSKMFEASSDLWPDIVGKLVSDSSLSDDVEPVECDSIEQAAGYVWQKHPDSKMFYHQSEQGIDLYFNGQMKRLGLSELNLDFCQLLCNHLIISIEDYYQILPDETVQLILQLINSRALIPVLEDE